MTPLFDVKEFLPEGIAPAQNGIILPQFLTKIYCGGFLCNEAARSWNAMVRAADAEDVFFNVNRASQAYNSIIYQRQQFRDRYVEVDPQSKAPPNAVRVEFDGKTWQLRDGKEYFERPGQSSHGFGLAVSITNVARPEVKAWLNEHAKQFGFVREYNELPNRYVYIASREGLPSKVLEVERDLPERKYRADYVAEKSGGHWLKAPPDDWHCNGMIYSRPLRTGALTVIDQGGGLGITEKLFGLIFRQCAAIVCTQPTENLIKFNRPILIVNNLKAAVARLKETFKEPPPIEVPVVDDDEPIEFYHQTNPETAIFRRKKKIARRLLEISVDDLKTAHEQPWYDEYHALLMVRLENPALRALGETFCGELRRWYDERAELPERELAVLGLIQFIEPMQLKVPFNQHLWSATMIADVRGVFLKQFTRISRSDAELATYYLARQHTWRHGRRKMRVALLIHSDNDGDKLLPVYDALKECESAEGFLILHPSANYQHLEENYRQYRRQYPNDVIYDTCSLMDLRRLSPDYVLFRTPYESRRQFPTFTLNDVVQFSKACNLSYGATLTRVFLDRLLDEYPQFYRSLYMMFCSGPSVRDLFIERHHSSVSMGYQHVEFLGYPALDKPILPMYEHSTRNVMWAPRWSYKARIGGSHFLEYKDRFIGLKARYGEGIKLMMRPHSNTFDDVVAKGLISAEEIADYRRLLVERGIELYSDNFDLDENFRSVDILLADYSSILAVFILTGRPIIYCEFPNAVPFPEYEEMFDCMYIARDWDEVLVHLDRLMVGDDPLYDRRQETASKLRSLHSGAAKRIVSRLLSDFNHCEE